MSANKDFYLMSINELRHEYNESYDNPIKRATVRQIIKEKYLEYKQNKKNSVNNSNKSQSTQNKTNSKKLSNRSDQSRKSQKSRSSMRDLNVDYDDGYEFTDDDFMDINPKVVSPVHSNSGRDRNYSQKYTNKYNSGNTDKENEYNRKMTNRTFELNDTGPELDNRDFNLLPNHGNLDELDDDHSKYSGHSNEFDDKFKKEVENDYVNNNLMDRMNSEMEIRNKKKSDTSNNKSFMSPYDNGGKNELFDIYYNERTNKNFKNKGS